MRFVLFALLLSVALSTCLVHAKEASPSSDSKLRAQSRGDTTKKSTQAMNTVLQQHLIGANVINSGNSDNNKVGGKEEKRGRLQTVGTVIGDIIGVLVGEVARFFGSVVSDVAREVTAHGFVSLLKQIADLTGISFGGSGAGHGAGGPGAPIPVAPVQQHFG